MAAALSTRPIYLQLRDVLRERIASGQWKPGLAIPNEGELAREFGVSPGTMRKALTMMEDERLVDRRQGRGTFVNDAGSETLAIRYSNIRDADGTRITGEIKSTPVTQGKADRLECDRLGLTPLDSVYRVRRVRLRDGQPFMVEDASMPAALFPGLASGDGYPHRIAALAQQHGMLLGKAQERVSVGAAAAEIAEALGIAAAAPVLVLDRVTQTLEGRAVEWRMGQCHLAGTYYMADMS